MTLRDVLEGVADELEVDSEISGDSIEWRRGDRAFAVATGDDAAEFDLDPAVARAAARTPDVQPSPRGDGWVVFRPALLDDHAADRAEAWFSSAWRLAGHS
ncbi:MAG: hypothetical protein ACJ761_11870 [Chloroflexota bacterium]